MRATSLHFHDRLGLIASRSCRREEVERTARQDGLPRYLVSYTKQAEQTVERDGLPRYLVSYTKQALSTASRWRRVGAVVRAVAACGALLALSTGARAQDDRLADQGPAPTQRSAKITDAVALALSDRASEVEATLATSLRHAPDSALGHLELASRLVRVAVECAANAKTEATDAFASRALEHLASARKLATEREAGAVASAWQLEGFIQLDFRGDREAALAAYREAAALAPEDNVLRAKVAQLVEQRSEDEERKGASQP